MLIKEYRILLPLTVDEYRIAQLYMIQKKSRLDSHGTDAGVEIITNRPYDDGPGGRGQYTFKIYHIGSKIPVWLRSVIPTNALEAHEEAWNSYPITKTRYSTPLMDRLAVEVDTLYFNDAGTQDNVFNLSPSELKQRVVDVMDFVKDGMTLHDYCAEEDPKLFRSSVTGRGPLAEDWVEECRATGKPIMCAYKLCRVEFRYWGLQTRAERWIHDLALRGTMLRAHRQAWAWQDEWCGLSIEDIRRLEAETALHLSAVMAGAGAKDENESSGEASGGLLDVSDEEEDASSNDAYYDCMDTSPSQSQKPSIIRWSSELLLDNDSPPTTPSAPKKAAALLILVFHGDLHPDGPTESKTTDTNTLRSTMDCLVDRHYPQLAERVHVLLVSVGAELSCLMQRVAALSASSVPAAHHPSFALLMAASQQQYSDAIDGAIRRANEVYSDFLETQPQFNGEVFVVGDAVGGLLLYEALAMRGGNHPPVSRHASSISATPTSRAIPEETASLLSSSDARRDSLVISFPDVSCISPATPSSLSSAPSLPWSAPPTQPLQPSPTVQPPVLLKDHSLPCTPLALNGHSASHSPLSLPSPAALSSSARTSSAPSSASYNKKRHSLSACSHTGTLSSPLHFQATAAFLLGCPLGLVLMQRRLQVLEIDPVEYTQMFNLYYQLDLCGTRIEPVLNPQLCTLPAASVTRYQRCPLGDGRSLFFDLSVDTGNLWGSKRHDHVLYCPNREESASTPSSVVSPSSPHAPVLSLPLPALHWRKRRTRFKITNLSPNHRANDVLVVSGTQQAIVARFCYGPMDLVALTREAVSVYICPARKEWYLHGVTETDSHGRLSLSLGRSLPSGFHHIKMVVQGDHSYLDAFICVVPPETPCVVFSIDGSLTASVSVTGRDPRVRPGAVDVVRYWHEQGFVLIYVTARPDMQQRAVASWLAQHNFPHALLYFAPSFSTEPLKHKASYLKQLQASGIRIHAAYGSSKDIAVYTSAGVELQRIVAVGGRRKQTGCVVVDSYSAHLTELSDGSSSLLHSTTTTDNNENKATLVIRRHRSAH